LTSCPVAASDAAGHSRAAKNTARTRERPTASSVSPIAAGRHHLCYFR
jgi:hypothetical protein